MAHAGIKLNPPVFDLLKPVRVTHDPGHKATATGSAQVKGSEHRGDALIPERMGQELNRA